MNMKRRKLERWLRSNGFNELPRGSSGHSVWEGHGLKLSHSAHVPTVSSGVVGQIVRKLESAGFERVRVRRDFGLS